MVIVSRVIYICRRGKVPGPSRWLDMADISRKLAGNNIAAFNINYRLAPEDRYPAQLNDVYAAMNFLVRSADEYPLDTQRMMTVGYSAGAHLALLAGSIPKEGVPTVNAIIAGGAPTDLRIYPDSPFIKDLIGGPPSDFPDVYREASPIVHATADHPPVFLYHGRLDLLVRPVNSFKMKAALEEAGVDVRLDIRALFGHLLTFAFDGPSISKGITFAKEYL